MKVLNKTKIK